MGLLTLGGDSAECLLLSRGEHFGLALGDQGLGALKCGWCKALVDLLEQGDFSLCLLSCTIKMSGV